MNKNASLTDDLAGPLRLQLQLQRRVWNQANFSLVINALGTGFIGYHWLKLWWLPPRSEIRPMGLVGVSVLNIFINACINASLASRHLTPKPGNRIVLRRQRVATWLGLFAPIITPIAICKIIFFFHQLSMQQ